MKREWVVFGSKKKTYLWAFGYLFRPREGVVFLKCCAGVKEKNPVPVQFCLYNFSSGTVATQS